MKTIIFAIISACFLTGCITTPEVHTTKQWENHYMNVEDFYSSTQDIKLDKGESIWVLSNSTLARLLKNVRTGANEANSQK